MKQRDTFVDIAKGICILLIICIHTEVFGIIGMPLTFIAVPMFFFMSGFYDRSEKPIKEWIGKTIRRLLFPALVWLIVGNFYLRLLGYLKNGIIEPYVFDWYNPQGGNGPVWFLIALFYAKILTGSTIRLKMSKWIIALCSLCVGYIGATYEMPLLVDEGMAAFPLYYVGKITYPYLNVIMNRVWLDIMGGIVLVVFITTEYYYNVGPVKGLYNPCYLLAILGAMSVFFPILNISEKMKKNKFLAALGKRSLEIMLIHTLICHTFAVILNRIFVVGSYMWIGSFLVAYIFIVFLSYYIGVYIKNTSQLYFNTHMFDAF